MLDPWTRASEFPLSEAQVHYGIRYTLDTKGCEPEFLTMKFHKSQTLWPLETPIPVRRQFLAIAPSKLMDFISFLVRASTPGSPAPGDKSSLITK